MKNTSRPYVLSIFLLFNGFFLSAQSNCPIEIASYTDLAGISNAILYNGKITFLVSHGSFNLSAYPDPYSFCNFDLRDESGLLSAIETGGNSDGGSFNLASKSGAVAMVYRNWVGPSYGFELKYKEFQGSISVDESMSASPVNWLLSPALVVGSNGTPQVAHFSAAGYYMLISRRTPTWTNCAFKNNANTIDCVTAEGGQQQWGITSTVNSNNEQQIGRTYNDGSGTNDLRYSAISSSGTTILANPIIQTNINTIIKTDYDNTGVLHILYLKNNAIYIADQTGGANSISFNNGDTGALGGGESVYGNAADFKYLNNGNLVVAYQTTSGELIVKENTGGTWTTKYTHSAITSNISKPTLLFKGANLYVVYSANSKVYMACVTCSNATLTATPTNPSCPGNETGSIALSSTAGTVTNYSFSNGTSTFPTTTGSNIPFLGAGTYTITATITGGCTATTTATLVNPVIAPIIATTTTATCATLGKGSIVLTSTGGTINGFNWTTNATPTSGNSSTGNTISNASAGIYQITATLANGCTTTSTNIILDHADHIELMNWYNSNNGSTWTVNWNTAPQSITDPTMTGWTGITKDASGCVAAIGSVTGTLNNKNISGSLPNFNLPNLQYLVLGSNQLSGTIPNFNLPNLQYLVLGFNQLSGTIPNFNLPSLQYLVLSNNQLNGTIPNFNLPNLQQLSLGNNQLSGAIPNFNLPSLQYLYLYSNQLSGAIPNFNLPNLQGLYLGNNQLSGTIPNFNLPNLQGLSLTNNQLSGTIPNFNLPNLQVIILSNNQLSGTIPNFNLPQLLTFSVQDNQFTCLDPALQSLCSHVTYGDISTNLIPSSPTWAQFCATGLGACIPCPTITALTQPSPTTCLGIGASFTISATVANGTGNYELIDVNNGNAVLSTVTGTATNGTISITYNTSLISPSGWVVAIRQTGSNTCTASATLNVPAPILPTTTASSNSPICAGATLNLTTTAVTGATYAWTAPATIALSSTSTQSPNVAGAALNAGNLYTVTVTTTNSCTATSSVSAVVNAQPTSPTATTTLNYCQNAIAPSLTATGTGLLWYNAATGGTGLTTAPIPNTSSVGAIDYYVSQTVAGCESPRTKITVTTNAAPTISIGQTPITTILTCMTSNITLNASGAGIGGIYNWNNGINNSVNAAITPMTYTVTGTNSNGCTASSSVVITQDISVPTVSTTSLNPVQLTCAVISASFTVTANGGTIPYSYQWGNPSPLSGQTTATIASASQGTYTCTVTGGNGCSASSASFTVLAPLPPPPAPSQQPIIAYCQNETPIPLSATATGNNNLVWYTVPSGGLGSTLAPTPSTATAGTTNYYVAQQGTNGCESPRTAVTVSVSPALILNLAANPSTINLSQSSVLTATLISVGQYTWDNNITSINNTTTVTPTSTTNYNVTVTNLQGCTATAQATVIVNTPACSQNDPITLSNLGNSINYTGGTWSGATLNASWQGVTTTPQGCLKNLSVTSLGMSGFLPSVQFSQLELMNFGNNYLTQSIPDFNDPSTNSSKLPELRQLYLNDNQFSGTVPNFNFPKAEDVEIHGNQLTGIVPDFDKMPLLKILYLQNNQLEACPKFTHLPLLNELNVSSNRLTFDDLIPNKSIATFVYSPQDSIYSNRHINKNVGDTALIDLKIDASISDNIYTWKKNGATLSPSASVVVVGNKLTFSNLQTSDNGVYYCEVTNPNLTGLKLISRRVVISISSVPCNNVTSAGTIGQNQQSCNPSFDPALLTSNSAASGGSGPAIVYSWYQGTTPVFDNTWTKISNVATTTYDPSSLTKTTYFVRVAKRGGCADSLFTNIIKISLFPTPIFNTPQIVPNKCFGESKGIIIVSNAGTAPFTYNWSNNISSMTATASNLIVGSYNVSVTDANSCTAVSLPMSMTEPTDISLTTAKQDIACAGTLTGYAQVSAFGGTPQYSYLWSYNNLTTASIMNVPAGVQFVTVTDANGCKKTASTTIASNNQTLVLTLTPTNVTCATCLDGSISTNTSGGITPYSYLWNNSATTEIISGLAIGPYSVTVTDAVGCTITKTANIDNGSTCTALQNGGTIGDDETQTVAFDPALINEKTAASGSNNTTEYVWKKHNSYSTDPNVFIDITGAASKNYDPPAITANTYYMRGARNQGCTTWEYSNVVKKEIVPCVPLTTTNLQKNCNSTNTAYSVSFTINGGTPPYTVNGTAILGNTFTSNSFNNNAPYNFLIDDANVACPSINVSGTHDCTVPCTTPISTTNLQKNCNGTNTAYSVSFTINGGTPPYTVNGTAILGNTFTSTSFNNNAPYSFLIDDANVACPSINVSGTHACTVTVPCANLPKPNFVLGSNNSICSDSTKTITLTSTFTSYKWSNNATTSSITIKNAATYSVTVTDSNQCTGTNSLTITAASAPSISLESDVTEFCTGKSAILNIKTTDPNLNYEWFLNNAKILNNAPAFMTNQIGSYFVKARNVQQCGAISNSVTLKEKTVTALSETKNICAGETYLTHSTTGIYKEIKKGKDNDCDTLLTVDLTVSKPPIAVLDTFSLKKYELQQNFNVAQNDQLSSKATYELLLAPTFGQLQLSNANLGLFKYTRTVNEAGFTQFQYRVCNDACPSECSQATVYLSLLNETIAYGPDGLVPDDPENGMYHIPRLDQNPCDCPNNEFYVINRWGEIVYSAKPFDNTKGWNGHTGKDDSYGAVLPPGTYYKLIKINIGNGEIHTGVITIVHK
jgi:hypothetical protein